MNLNKLHTQVFDLKEFTERYGLQDHELLNVLPSINHPNPWVAGGAVRNFVRNLPIASDIDVFFKTEADFEFFVKRFVQHKTDETKHHTTFDVLIGEKKYKVQAIRIAYYDSAESVIDSFDYTICQLAIDGDDLVLGKYTLWDLARNRLAVHKITYAAASVRRMLKYAKQRFTACQGCITTLLSAVADDRNLIRSDVTYVD